MDAQAKSLDLVKRIVVLNKTGVALPDDLLILYQRLIMYQQKPNVNFIVQTNSAGAPVEAVNARAYRQLSEGGLAAPAPAPSPDTQT